MKRFISFAVLLGFLIFAGMAFAEEVKPADMPAPAAVTSTVAETPAAPKIDTGDTAWMIVATALVMLMSIPGLALFYGGLSKRKDSLNTMAMTFVAFCIVSLLWVLYGFSFSFNGDIGGFIGNGAKALLKGVGPGSINDLAKTIPEYIFIVYQLTFAAITVALASGAYIERMKFSAWIMFSVLWMTLVYLPVAHWVWGGGFLSKMGALDFAGGTVVHINAGAAALVGALILGKRTGEGPHPRQSDPGSYRCRSPLVRVVRVQCRFRTCRKRPGRRCFYQYQHGRGCSRPRPGWLWNGSIPKSRQSWAWRQAQWEDWLRSPLLPVS